MTEVIMLSDSDESISSTHNISHEKVQSIEKSKRINTGCMLDSFHFPAVQFDYIPSSHDLSQSQNSKNDDCISQKIFTQLSNSNFSNTGHDNQNFGKRTFVHQMSSSCESETNDNEYLSQQLQEDILQVEKKDKKKLRDERVKRQETIAKEKALKAIVSKKLRDMKPGQCMKFMKVILDVDLKNYVSDTEFLTTLKNVNVQYTFTSQLIPKCITWERNVEENYLDENDRICTKTCIKNEKQIIIVWNWDEALCKVADNAFCTSISNMKSLLPDYAMTLVIFGLRDYFVDQKKNKKLNNNKCSENKTQKHNKGNSKFGKSLEVSKQQLEESLAEIQITCKCNSRIIDNTDELALMIYQYTKAIAETPFKLEKKQRFDNECNWYVVGDNRDTVKVDKDGNGLKRLWQQQLCQFHLSSLEVAEAICTTYKSPRQLIETYINCTSEEGAKLLKDIPIRRAAGPLTAVRRVGPELSKRIYTMFTSQDGDIVLGND